VDALGAVLIAVTLGGLQLAVQWLPRPGWAAYSALAATLSGLGLWALLRWERRVAQPLLPAALFASADLRRLFLLSVLAGAIMFVLLFYLPLLLQGSLGYAPQAAGLLITPLALCITLGAIVNGRIITRLANPNVVPMAGFALLSLSCAALAAVALLGLRPPFAALLALMFGAGLGLGFVLMNLTLFTQTLAARRDLGIATALSQSLRLVGGMLGTATVGAAVGSAYQHGVAQAVGSGVSAGVLAQLSDPKLLLGHASHAALLEALRFAGPDPAGLLVQLQAQLSIAIGGGLAGLTLLGALALWTLHRTAPVPLR
jgi:predicted MFS family arabinose efflux permease